MAVLRSLSRVATGHKKWLASVLLGTILSGCGGGSSGGSTPTPANQAPVANAGSDQSVDELTTVTLSGSGTDTDGSIASYHWVQTGGTIVALDNADSASTTFIAPDVKPDEVLSFSLTVTDDDGSTGVDTVDITVTHINQMPQVAVSGTTVDEGQSVSLSAQASDSDGAVMQYLWVQASGPSVTLTGADTMDVSFVAPMVDSDTSLSFTVTVTDDEGGQGTATATVMVTNTNVAPVANAGADQSVNEGDTVTLDGSGSSDQDGTIASYLWTQQSGSAVTLSDATAVNPTFVLELAQTQPELLSFDLAVTDNDGNVSHDDVTITVNQVPSVIVAAIVAPDVAATNTDVTFSSAATTTTGKRTLSYSWQVTEAPVGNAGTVGTPTGQATQFSGTTEGAYKVMLTVSDGTASDTADATITLDLDGDGVLSADDVDKDGDGILNADDAFPESRSEWVDSDGNGVGNYAQTDEDGDGTLDSEDDYPFDPLKTTMSAFAETEFNGNLYPDGNEIGSSYPLKVTGSIEAGSGYQVDTDYFLFTATGGDIISVVLTKGANAGSFSPSVSIMDDTGAPMTVVNNSVLGDSALVVSTRIPADGKYAFSVSDTNNAVSADFTYNVSVFKDSDMDGLSDETELAMGMIGTTPDADGDGLTDGFEYVHAKAALDGDSDGLPVWWDTDSDNDSLPDQAEGGSDVDGDGLANFIDSDSDGNGIADNMEVGGDPLNPVDSDADTIADFLDLDDDNDGLLDVNDTDRTTPVEVAGLDGSLVVFNAQTTLAGQSIQIDGVARSGDTVTVSGEGFGSDPIVVLYHQSGTENLTPTSKSATQVSFVVPALEQDSKIRLYNGDKISEYVDIRLVDTMTPIIHSITMSSGMDYASPGEFITIEGENFSTTSSVNVSFNGVSATASVFSSGSLSVTVPGNAVSGGVQVISDGTSNAYPLEIRQGTSGTVTLPTGSTLTMDQLNVEFGALSSTIASDGSFFIGTRNQGPTSLSVFAPQRGDEAPAMLLSATVMPGQSLVAMSPNSTAADLVYSAMGLESTIRSEDQITALDIVTSAVAAFGEFLDTQLGADPYYLQDYQQQAFVDKYLEAIGLAGTAIDAAIADGTIIVAQPRSANRATALSRSDPAKIIPSASQQDFVIKLLMSNDNYNGKMELENDTMMFADVEATNVYNGSVVRKAVNGYFSSDLIGPQSGIFAFYWGNSAEIDLAFRSANILIYTPGLQDMESWSSYRNSPSFKLALRTLLSQALVPVINAIVGVKFEDSTTNLILNIMFKYGVFNALETFWTNPSKEGFYNGFAAIVKTSLQATFLEDVVQAIAKSYGPTLVKKIAVKLGLKLTPWGSAATVVTAGGTAIDLAKLATDVGTTSGKIRFKIIFPINVEAVEPGVIIKDDQPKQVKLIGDGLGPIVRSSFFSKTVYYPKVEFTDANGKTYTDDNPSYESYFVAPGSAAPRSPLKVMLPADYLKDAVSPLSVKLHHHLIDEDLLSDDISAVTLDTQHSINLVDELTLSSISPDSGSWGDTVTLFGAGFSNIVTDNAVYFTGESGSLAAMVVGATSTELKVVVPRNAQTGNVWVVVSSGGQQMQSNNLTFTLLQQNYTFVFGDNGALNDDTFALYIDGQLVRTMAQPTRTETVTWPLSPGRHTVQLHGITAPDAVGTYYIDFPSGVTVVSGSAQSGSDLTAGVVKSWVIEVGSGRPAPFVPRAKPPIIWQQEGRQ